MKWKVILLLQISSFLIREETAVSSFLCIFLDIFNAYTSATWVAYSTGFWTLLFPLLTLYLEIILYWHVQIDLILLLVFFFFLKFNFVFEIGNTFKSFRNQNHWKRNILRSLTSIPVSPAGVPLPPWASAFINVSFQGLFVWHSLYFVKCLAILLTNV